TAPMILNSDEVPDVMEYNKGNATAGFLSQNGLLTDITDVAIERGWDQILSPGLQTTSRYENGIMGSGPWYGVTNYGEFVMVYYNVDMFEEYGVEVPTTLEEFENVMQTFVDAGITPLSLGATEYPAQHVSTSLFLARRTVSGLTRSSFTRAMWTSTTKHSPSPPRRSSSGPNAASSPKTRPASPLRIWAWRSPTANSRSWCREAGGMAAS